MSTGKKVVIIHLFTEHYIQTTKQTIDTECLQITKHLERNERLERRKQGLKPGIALNFWSEVIEAPLQFF